MATDLSQSASLYAIQELANKIKEVMIQVEELEEAGGEENVIESITVNGTPLTPDAQKDVKITVPTKTSDLTNDKEFQTAEDVEELIGEKLGAVYTPKGTITFSELASTAPLSADSLGFVYNISDAFNTTADFVEGSEKSYPAGTNVAVVEPSTGTYKYDALSGSVDLSGYYTKTEIDNMTATDQEIDDLLSGIFGT